MSSKPRLLVLSQTCLEVVDRHRAWIESQGIELLADPSLRDVGAAEAAELLREADALILPATSINRTIGTLMAESPRLLVCSIAASGYEWFDVEAATRHGVVVTYAPGGEGAEVVADLAWGLMFAAARQIPYHDQLVRNGGDRRGIGSSVYGRTLGILGLGHIGRAMARRAAGFAMKVLATASHPDQAFVRDHGIEIVSKEALLEQADFVSLHLRLSDATRGILGRDELRRMKPTAYLINTARKELVDEDALVAAILEKKIAGAGLDDPPGEAGKKLLGLPTVVFTPHIGNRAIEGMNSVLCVAVENAVAVLRGQRPAFAVNPEVYDGRLRQNPWSKGDALKMLKSTENAGS